MMFLLGFYMKFIETITSYKLAHFYVEFLFVEQEEEKEDFWFAILINCFFLWGFMASFIV